MNFLVGDIVVLLKSGACATVTKVNFSTLICFDGAQEIEVQLTDALLVLRPTQTKYSLWLLNEHIALFFALSEVFVKCGVDIRSYMENLITQYAKLSSLSPADSYKIKEIRRTIGLLIDQIKKQEETRAAVLVQMHVAYDESIELATENEKYLTSLLAESLEMLEQDLKVKLDLNSSVKQARKIFKK